jgi:hypothetical protein
VSSHLPAGTWVGIGAVDNLVTSEDSVAGCELLNASRSKAFDAASASLPQASLASPVQITNLGVVTIAKKAEIDGRCGEFGAADPPSIASAGWAFIKP